MALTVYAENMGLFHKGSGGKGIAPGDVCLTPPPPPGGPAPIPYVNMAAAADLAKGSSTVTVDGEPTALEDKSECSTSSGDEAGTQGGNVVTHKTKGKAFFQLWSSTVMIEGKGVCRHGDLMGQNSGTPPAGCIDMAALVTFKTIFPDTSPCKRHFKRSGYGPTYGPGSQDEFVQGKPCWVIENGVQCGKPGATADHQPPLLFAWYKGGCNGRPGEPKKASFKAWALSNAAVKPQCAAHSMRNPQKGTSFITKPKLTVTIATVSARIAKYLL
jgi:uncharacterized Zn-binding protein involved in type VI secretion